MAQGSRQVQTQAQQQIQTLSPQQILVVKLLELPAVELEDRVRAELLENPALEEGKEDTPGDEYPDTPDAEPAQKMVETLAMILKRLSERRRYPRLQAAGEQPQQRGAGRRNSFLRRHLLL